MTIKAVPDDHALLQRILEVTDEYLADISRRSFGRRPPAKNPTDLSIRGRWIVFALAHELTSCTPHQIADHWKFYVGNVEKGIDAAKKGEPHSIKLKLRRMMGYDDDYPMPAKRLPPIVRAAAQATLEPAPKASRKATRAVIPGREPKTPG